MQTYWELSVRQFFDEWKQMKTPLTHPEHFVTKKQEKILLTIDDLVHKTKQQPTTEKKRGRPKKKAI
ncbi:hypothetical protein [Anoxybacillus sp. ST4]|uniref:hypothetical protein n=1 Tax=Anoxybacillus sp. ST4 TaxID=2864181 RepID=UPI001C63FEAC|nr:hypothetical protein [Anoxybacillus sp. ST4]MBW7649811.1 hypothetical protein [Anoxybacillus sp. ST4]